MTQKFPFNVWDWCREHEFDRSCHGTIEHYKRSPYMRHWRVFGRPYDVKWHGRGDVYKEELKRRYTIWENTPH